MSDTPEPTQSIGTRVAIGVAWMALLKLIIRALALISLTILARLLSPGDFGLVAMAMFLYAILNSLAWFGFDTALIQNQKAEAAHYDTAFTYNVIMYTAVAIVLGILAIPAAHYYQEPRVENIIYVLALGAFITGFANIGTVDFRKKLNYQKDFYFMVSTKILAFCVTIPLAFWLRNYWALVIGALAGRVTAVAASYLLSPYRPSFTLAKTADLFYFSKWLMLNNIFFAIRTRIAEPIVGRTSGAVQLGYFNMAYEISNLPTTELVAPINRAVYPGYAMISHDIEQLRNGYLKVIGIIALIALPAAAGMAAVAELLVPVWLGDKWIESVPMMKILAWSGALTVLMTNLGSVYLALGKTKLLALTTGIYVAVLLAIIWPLTQKFGPIGAAWAYVITSLLVNPIQYWVLFRTLGLKFSRFLNELWRPLVATAIMYFSVQLLVINVLIPSDIPDVVSLFLAVGTGVLIYMALAAILWRVAQRPEGAERYIVDKVWPQIRQRLHL